LVYSGRLGPEKNIDFLLRSFCGAAEALDRVHLLLIGGGPEDDNLKKLASQLGITNRVHFIGMIGYELMPRFLSMCDLFVTASVTEVHPLSVIEAMASGLPALGIHSVGVGDIIEDGRTGLLASQNQAAFAAKMTRLCLDKDLRLRMGNSARQISEKYGIERITRVMLAHYEHLAIEALPRRHTLISRLRTFAEKLHE
jgi:glycosyltransferase involved in cell wall biosynthesis